MGMIEEGRKKAKERVGQYLDHLLPSRRTNPQRKRTTILTEGVKGRGLVGLVLERSEKIPL